MQNLLKKVKTMIKFKSFLFVFSILHFIIAGFSQNPNPSKPPSSAHSELTNYGFPIGLLPLATILSHSINQTSGEFYVDIGGACKVTLPPDNYMATYSKRITGKIDHGRMAKLDGIRVRAFFKWWSINGIRSSGENLVFEVGGITVKYPSKNFNESLPCEGKHSAS